MTRIEEQRAAVTMDEAKAEIGKRGFTPASWSWEDDFHVYAFSVEDCGPTTYGASRCTAHYNKVTGWFTVA